jgi:glycosyltransferase involved in cell wall biosynthesis
MEKGVEFLFEGASEEELHAILSRAHFYVFPNHIPIWSMSSFEAMAAGLVLLVSSVTSVAEALRDGDEARFFPSGDCAAIAECALELVRNPGEYSRIAEKGQRFVKEHLGWDIYIQNLMHAASSHP